MTSRFGADTAELQRRRRIPLFLLLAASRDQTQATDHSNDVSTDDGRPRRAAPRARTVEH